MAENNASDQKQVLPSVIPLVALESSPVLPGLMASLHIPPGKSAQAVENAMAKNRVIGLLMPRKDLHLLPAPDSAESSAAPRLNYELDDLHHRGVTVRILKRIKMPDESMNLLVHGVERFQVSESLQKEPFLCATVRYFQPRMRKDQEIEALARTVIQQVKHLSDSNPYFTEEMRIAMINAPNPGSLADMVAFSIMLSGEEAQSYIETVDVRERFMKLLVYLRRERDVADVQKKLGEEVDQRVAKFQREFFLKEQLKTIRQELGMDEDDKSREFSKLEARIEEAKLPPAAAKVAKEELSRLKSIPEASPEYHMSRTYVEWIADLPWSKSTEDNLDLGHAREILEDSHFGLKDVKDRILEFLAVRTLKADSAGSILCFVGPPGVGKTSLGKAIAEAMGREFFRFSLGGMRDEAEIKGHRRTYVGAMPGKILQGLKRVGVNNAVIMLDEIDKLGKSFHGDPGSALLEVLDPEQNNAFQDHYLDIPFDLSKVMFLANANSLDSIPDALRDRLEIIELPGYTLEEKEKIARKFVIPRSLEKHGLKKGAVKIPVTTLRSILRDYAREPGVRTLQQQADKISRRIARLQVENRKRKPKVVEVKREMLQDWLGPQRFYNETAQRVEQPGVMVGLAWTPTGGDILFVEALALEGSGELKVTGQLGEVMEESSRIALSHVKKYLSSQESTKLLSLYKNKKTGKAELLTPAEWFKKHDIHLHLPAGAIPKDGPSAGITLASAILSLVTGRLARARMAMTGELSLVGKVLPVGGIRDKILAAKRSGIRHVVLPALNKKDVKEIPAEQLKGLKLSYTERVTEVFDLVLRQ